MKKQDYLIAIADAETATQLHSLLNQSKTDGELFAVMQREIADAVGGKFCALNAATKPNRTARWDR